MKTLLEAMDPNAVNYTMMQTADLLRTIMGFGASAKSDAANPQYSYTVQIASGATHDDSPGKECVVVLDKIMSKIYSNFGGFPCARNTVNTKDREDRKILFLISVCIPDVAERIMSLAAAMGMRNAVNRFNAMYTFYKDSFHGKLANAASEVGDAVISSVNLMSKSPVGYDSDTSTYSYLDKLGAWNRNVLDTVNNVVNATGVKSYVKDNEIDTAVWMVSAFCMFGYLTENIKKIAPNIENVDYVHVIQGFLDMITGKDKTVETIDEDVLSEDDADGLDTEKEANDNEKKVFRKDLTLSHTTQRGTVTDKTQFTGRFVIGLIASNFGELLPSQSGEKYAMRLAIAQEALRINGLITKTSTIPKAIGRIVDEASANIASNPISDVIEIRKRLLATLTSDEMLKYVENTLLSGTKSGKRLTETLISDTAKAWLCAGKYRHTGVGTDGNTYVISGTNQPSACFGDEAYNDKNAHNGSLTTAGTYVNRHMVNSFDDGYVAVVNDGAMVDQIPFSQLANLTQNYISAGVIEMIGASKNRYYGAIYGINAYSEVQDSNFADLEEISPFTSELGSRLSSGANPYSNKQVAAAAKMKEMQLNRDKMQQCAKAGFIQSANPVEFKEFIEHIRGSLKKFDKDSMAGIYGAAQGFVQVCQGLYRQFDAVEFTGTKPITSLESLVGDKMEQIIPSGTDLINNVGTVIDSTCNQARYIIGDALGVIRNPDLVAFVNAQEDAVDLQPVIDNMHDIRIDKNLMTGINLLNITNVDGKPNRAVVEEILQTVAVMHKAATLWMKYNPKSQKLIDLVNDLRARGNQLKRQYGTNHKVIDDDNFVNEIKSLHNDMKVLANAINTTKNIGATNQAVGNILDDYYLKVAELLQSDDKLCAQFGVSNQAVHMVALIPSLIGETYKAALTEAARKLTRVTPERYISTINEINKVGGEYAKSQIDQTTSFVEVGRRVKVFDSVYQVVANAAKEISEQPDDFSDTSYAVNQIPEGRELGKDSLGVSDVDVASGYELHRIQNELASEDLAAEEIMRNTDYVDNLVKLLENYQYYANREKELADQIEQYKAAGGTVPNSALVELEKIRFTIDSNPKYQAIHQQISDKVSALEQKAQSFTDAGEQVPPDLEKQLERARWHLGHITDILDSHRNGLKDSVQGFIKDNPQVSGVANAVLSGSLSTEDIHTASIIVGAAGDILNQLKKKDVTYAYTMSDITAIAQTVYTIGRHVFTEDDAKTEVSDLISELDAILRIIENRSGNPLSIKVIANAKKSILGIQMGETGDNGAMLATALIKTILNLGRFIISSKSQYAEYLSGKDKLAHTPVTLTSEDKDDAVDALARTQVTYGQSEHNKTELSAAEKEARRGYIDAVRSEMKENPDLAKYAYSVGVALNHFDYSLTDPRFSKNERISRMYNSIERSTGKGMLLGSTDSGSTKITSNYIQMEVLNAVIDDEQKGTGGASGSYPEVKKVLTSLLTANPVVGYAKNYTNEYSTVGGYSSTSHTGHYMHEDDKGNIVADTGAGTGQSFTMDQIFNRVNPEYPDRETTLNDDGTPSDDTVKAVVRAARQLVYTNVTRNIGKLDDMTGDVELNDKYTGKAAKEAIRSLYRLTNDLDTPISYVIVATMHLGTKAGREALIADAEDLLTGKKGDGNVNIDDMAYISNMAGAFPQKMTDRRANVDDMWINTVVGIMRNIPRDMSNADVRECLQMYNGSRLTRNEMIKNSGNYTVMFKIFSRLEQLDTDSGIHAGFFGDDSSKRKKTIEDLFNYVLDDTVDGSTDAEKREGQLDKVLAAFAEDSEAGYNRLNFHGVLPTESARMQIAHMRMNPNSISRDIPYKVFTDLITRLADDGYITRVTKSSIALKYTGLVFDWNTFKYFARQIPTQSMENIKEAEYSLDVIISSHLTGIPIERYYMLLTKQFDPSDVSMFNVNNVVNAVNGEMCATEVGPIPTTVVLSIVSDLQKIVGEDGEVTNELFVEYVNRLKDEPDSKTSYLLQDIERGPVKGVKKKAAAKKKTGVKNPVGAGNSNDTATEEDSDEEPQVEVHSAYEDQPAPVSTPAEPVAAPTKIAKDAANKTRVRGTNTKKGTGNPKKVKGVKLDKKAEEQQAEPSDIDEAPDSLYGDE